jgi:hypothetical protein
MIKKQNDFQKNLFSPLSAIGIFCISLILFANQFAQTPESQTEQIKLGRIWSGVAANGDQATFDFRAGFFPNDYDILQYRGQYNENFTGSGFRMADTGWLAPNDSLYRVAIFNPKNDFMPNGKVTVPITSYLRYKYPVQIINGNPVNINDFADYNPSQLTGGTYDQKVESTYKNVLGVLVHRKILVWGQNYNDNYIIVDVELTNEGVDHGSTLIKDTLRYFYFMMNQGLANTYYSYGNNPSPQSSETPHYAFIWQHYYGGRQGDSLRVFYSYSADDPTTPGDNMGAPVVSQGGNLINTDFAYTVILHASVEPYTDPANDADDFLQPKITYIGNETKLPDPGAGDDPFGSRNFWAMRGGYADNYPMSNTIAGTHHGINNDELGTPDFSAFIAGSVTAPNSRNFMSFGPYNFPPDTKIHIVYAVGFTGIGIQKSIEVGKKWLKGSLENPPGMPNTETGWLPSNFVFPVNATEVDKRKDRWISMGIDSVMLSAWRAKWNYEHNYQIPVTPPPPSEFNVTGLGTGVEIRWKDAEAEAMPNFAGYRIMRRLSAMDTVAYEPIYDSDQNDKAEEHLYSDKSFLFGAQYFYYIQSKAKIGEDDLNADPTTRGKIIYSNRTLIPNVTKVIPPRPSQQDLTKIRIVPNPYNINDPLLQKALGVLDERQISFVNLPVKCTIKIFTENGDLVQTLIHDKPTENSGSEDWDMITSSQQVISSGVYIAVFQMPGGDMSYQKFIVVR